MKLFLWKTSSIFLSATIIIFACSANPLPLQKSSVSVEDKNVNLSVDNPVTTKNVNLSVDNPIAPKKCKSKTFDGTSYIVACNEGTQKIVSVTDSEVKDLTSFPPSIKLSTTSTTGKPHYSIIASTTTSKPLSVVSTTTKIDELTVDRIVQPEEHVHPNSKFNLTTGGIAAVICLSVAVVFYIGVMMWKRVVMNAYQNREILLNDDDIGDINDEDMRHFEAACIQIDA